MTEPEQNRPLVLVIPDTDDGSAYRLALSLIRRAPTSFPRLIVVSLAPAGPAAVEFEHADVPLFSLEWPPRFGRHQIRDVFVGVLRLWTLLRKIEPRPAIVHALGDRASILARIAARMAGVPFVFETHKRAPGRHGFLNDGFGRWTAALTDHAFALSNHVAERVIQRYGLHPARVTALAPGVETGRVSLPKGPRSLGPHVLAVARWSEEHDADTLFEAVALLHRFHPTLRVSLVGAGPAGLALQSRVRRLGSLPITMVGERGDIAKILTEADVFVAVPLRGGCPFALLEAMAAGIPCVAHDVPGVREVVDAERHLSLVPVGKPALLADAIDLVLLDPRSAAERAFLAKQRVLESARAGPLVAEIHRVHERSLATLARS